MRHVTAVGQPEPRQGTILLLHARAQVQIPSTTCYFVSQMSVNTTEIGKKKQQKYLRVYYSFTNQVNGWLHLLN